MGVFICLSLHNQSSFVLQPVTELYECLRRLELIQLTVETLKVCFFSHRQTELNIVLSLLGLEVFFYMSFDIFLKINCPHNIDFDNLLWNQANFKIVLVVLTLASCFGSL